VARDVEIELLRKEIERSDAQINRIIAHVESEQRVYNGTAKRVDMLDRLFDNQQKLLEKLDGILRNGNGGLQLRVDRLEQKEKENRIRLTMWLAILSGAVSLLSLIYQMTQK
jgi:hypothetical protein